MQRSCLESLIAWKSNKSKKPILLRGARQVGKSYLIRELLAPMFDKFVECNLERQPDIARAFSGDLSARVVLNNLQVLLGQEISEHSLLFIDEIQVEPKAINALRYLYEEAPQIPVVAAGSLLEFAIGKVGVPVGRIEFLQVSPLTFEEYLFNTEGRFFLDMLGEHDLKKPLPDIFHRRGISLLREYLAIGGMPEVCQLFIDSKNLGTIESLQGNLLEAYRNDFPRYASKDPELKRISAVFERIPHIVGKPIKFVEVSREFQARDIRAAIDQLDMAQVISKVYRTSGNPIAALANHDRYKLNFIDVGLMQKACGQQLKNWIISEDHYIHSGAIAEQFVGQQIKAISNIFSNQLYFWERPKSGSSAEIDYLISVNGQTIPVEVKAGARGRLRSMNEYLNAYPLTPFGIKTSLDNFAYESKVWSVPLYAFGTWLKRSVDGRLEG
jgi:predicted AAA+ superfamily ATPase